jgi:DNA-binding CsgD family transcriptional regulator
MKIITKKLNKTSVQEQKLNHIDLPDSQRAYFLQEVIESLQDGILILNETGEIIHANTSVYRIFSQFHQDSSHSNTIPKIIWNFCQSLLDNNRQFSNQFILQSNEIVLDRSKVFRIRAKWLDLDKFPYSCLLVIIENKHESLKNVALSEVEKYELTPREAEIWYLYRAKFTYKEIAAQLYITVNTVKKHMKNIHAKRQAFFNIS